MINFFTFSAAFSFFVCLLLGVFYAWILYAKLKHLSLKFRIFLGVLRIIAVALIAWMLFAPLFKRVSYTPEKPIIILANDNSLSVSQIKPTGFDEKRYQNDMRELLARLSTKYDVKAYNFSDSVKPGLDFSGNGKLSNGTALIEQLKDELVNRNLGAVIIASDGIFNRGGNPLYELKQLNAPIYTIALGDTIPKKDVLIAEVNHNDLVYLDNEFNLGVQVQAYQAKGDKSTLTVTQNDVQVKAEGIEITSNSFLRNIQIKLKANKVGIQKYTISVSGLKNEITTKNNTQTIFIEVIDSKQKVLLAAGNVHPDVSTLKQAIELNEHYEVNVVLADDLNKLDLKTYSLAILYQFPANNSSMSSRIINDLKFSKIPLWFVLGAQSNINGFHDLQKLVKISAANGSLQEVFPVAAPNFTLFQLEQNAIKQFPDYDPLASPFGSLSINGNYSAPLNQRIGKINTNSPLLFYMNENERKMGFLIGEGIWKWRLTEARSIQTSPLVNELIAKTLQYLSAKDDKRKFKVYTNKNTFEENERIILQATLYNDAYELINSPAVMIQIKPENGKVFNYNFSKFDLSYRLDIGSLPEGNYNYTATTQLGEMKLEAKGSFYIKGLIAEYQQTTANHQLLNTMSLQNNGKMVMPVQLLSLAELLEKSDQVKTINYEDRKYEELISLKWLFALILLLLSVEWFLRKRSGEV